jgi:hypothetical protein
VPPCSTANNIADLTLSNSELVRQSLLRDATFGIPAAYLTHRRLGELGEADPFTTGVKLRWALTPSPLAISIDGVVLMCAEEQMIRATARRIVTVMENEQPIRDRSEGELPGHSVCENT